MDEIVYSSSLLATSYLVHSACFQHEADQSRGFIATVVTIRWNSNSTHLSAFGTNMSLLATSRVACPSHHPDVHLSQSLGTHCKSCCRRHRKVSFSKNQSCTVTAYLRNLEIGYVCRCLIDSGCTPHSAT